MATNFTINSADVLAPTATEEPSVIAAPSNAARLARARGGFRTSRSQPICASAGADPGRGRPRGARLLVLNGPP
ncbi:hypothetical protein [Saccharopolyspora halophila]|uniref:hypothetical protein n=1 Tax=Saccharopolyspora halophila TaxID=405551 RepID=UPI0031DEA7A4